MIWFTADTHFGHKNIIDFCNRPFSSVEEQDEELIRRWNVLVKPNDHVYHLGDFAFKAAAPLEEYRARLNGRITLILGNHDVPARCRNAYLNGRSCFEDVLHTLYLRHNNYRFWLSHYAHRVWPKSHHGTIHLFGHSHGELSTWGRSMDVGVDAVMGYAPISLDEVVERLGNAEVTNHHPIRNPWPRIGAGLIFGVDPEGK